MYLTINFKQALTNMVPTRLFSEKNTQILQTGSRTMLIAFRRAEAFLWRLVGVAGVFSGVPF
jgi:hypothetical protein